MKGCTDPLLAIGSIAWLDSNFIWVFRSFLDTVYLGCAVLLGSRRVVAVSRKKRDRSFVY